MIYIDFYCDESKVADWRKWCSEQGIDQEDEPECRTGYITRGQGVMSYYFRLLCIAAYREISTSPEDVFQGQQKQDICKALLDMCPPDSAALQACHQDRRSKEQHSMMKTMFAGFGPAALREEPPPKVNMAALENDYNLKSKLSAIGLGPMADWVSYGYQWHAIPGSIILACATMFTRYLDAVPTEAKQLDGTPYSNTQNMDDNLDSNGCVEYRGELEPSFRNTAQFGDSCRGEHC